jgi:hypothetical protein
LRYFPFWFPNQERSVTLNAQQRGSIYRKLLPILGDDDTDALMTQFPSIEADELVTKQFLRAELNEQIGSLRSEVHEQVGSLRSDVYEQIGSLRAELAQETGSLRAEMTAMELRLTLRLGAGLAAWTALLAGLGRVF